MSAELTRQLSAWLAATDIALLELRAPGVDICLWQHDGQIDTLPPGHGRSAARATQPIKAQFVGVFLHSHPLHDTALAALGQEVVAGQAIGLLRIGALLLPVLAPRDSIVTGYAVAHGVTVGYGTPLVDLIWT
jgi:acetyl-CoA carboxylase biotin carboxyl carrier protein